MAKYFSFVAKDVNPLSQNNRSLALLNRLRNDLINAHNQKYSPPEPRLPRQASDYILKELKVKVFYIHKVPDRKDADNISKPL